MLGMKKVMYVFVLTWEPLSEFLLNSFKFLLNLLQQWVTLLISSFVKPTQVIFHQLLCQVWKLILNGRVCSVKLCCELLQRCSFLTSYFPFNQRRQQQAQSSGRLINQLSCHSDCLLNQCGRVALSVLVVVMGAFLPNMVSL